MRKGPISEPDPVNSILFFYNDRIGPLGLFAHEYLLELIREFGESEIRRGLEQAACKGRVGERVFATIDRELGEYFSR